MIGARIRSRAMYDIIGVSCTRAIRQGHAHGSCKPGYAEIRVACGVIVARGGRVMDHDTSTTTLMVPHGMVSRSWSAMGTTITALLPEAEAAVACASIVALFADWEARLSRFAPENALADLNRQGEKSAARGVWVTVDPLLYMVLATALQAAQATDGIFDPSLLRQLRAAGYDRSFELLETHQPARSVAARPGGGWRAIRLDASAQRVYLPPETEIDLGGIAKGMAVDAALLALREAGLGAALINAGGDLAVLGVPPGLDQWTVGLGGDALIGVRAGALATSGTTWRRWYQGEIAQHHLLDPRTGEPVATELAVATVAAANCAQAEIAAKVAFILGTEAGLMFLQRHALEGVLVLEDGTRRGTPDWPEVRAVS